MIQNEFDILNNLFDTLPSGLLIFKPAGKIVRINQRGKDLLRLDEICTESIQDFSNRLEPLTHILLNTSGNIHREEVTLTFDEQPEPITIGFSIKCMDDVRILTFSDITQVVQNRLALERIQNELHQSKKLASLGTLVAGVAHELNNPLTGISMSVSLIKMNLERLLPTVSENEKLNAQLEKALSEVQKIIRANEKASVLVNDLLAYSKPAQLVLTPVPIAEMVKEMVNALKDHSQFSQIQFCIENSSSHLVLCDPVKLEQVFYNLFKNAADAMGSKGKLTLRFDEALLDSKPAVVVQVQDNGPGIDSAVINRIFDPFFTTKGHSGVGLGLSVSYRTVEQHGGLLSVESPSGQGAQFTIKLPVYLGQEAQPANLSG